MLRNVHRLHYNRISNFRMLFVYERHFLQKIDLVVLFKSIKVKKASLSVLILNSCYYTQNKLMALLDSPCYTGQYVLVASTFWLYYFGSIYFILLPNYRIRKIRAQIVRGHQARNEKFQFLENNEEPTSQNPVLF
jgi:hypothetical protein